MAIWYQPPRTQQPKNNFAVLSGPPPAVLLEDDFDDNSRDTAKWTLGSIAFENAAVGVDEANQQVEITPLALTGSPAIYGYKSLNTYDFTGREASIRIAADIDPNTEAWLVVALDASNYIRTWVAGGTLQTRSRVAAGNTNESHGTFSFTSHTYWRIRHDDNSDEIVWEYSPDGGEWLELRRLARPITITSVSVYLSGGTGASVASPGLVKFDDFNLRTPTAFNVVSRIAGVSATAGIASAAQFFSIFERASAIGVTAAVETAAQFFTTLGRNVTVDASASVTVAGERIVERSTSLSSTATIGTVGESFSVFEVSVSASATGSVESSGIAFTVFESTVSISASTTIDTSGAFFSVAERVATVDSTGLIATEGVRIVGRSISITITADVIANAEFLSVLERAASIDATVSITVSGQTTQQRQSALSATAGISVSGVIVPPDAVEHEREAGISAVGSIESSAIFFSVAVSAVDINTSAEIFTTADFFSTFDRSLEFSATGEVLAIGQREIHRNAALFGSATVTVSGSILNAPHERAITISVTGSVSVSGIRVVPLDPRHTITVGSETRKAAVNQEGRIVR